MYSSIKGNLFLATSCITAIAAVGSIFELASGEPDLGAPITTAILAVSIPLTIWLFLAAVSAARAKQDGQSD